MSGKNKDYLRIISEIFFLLVFVIFFRQRALQRWIMVFGIGVIISLIFSRLYCAWACPIETLFRPINWIYNKLGIKRLKVPDFFKKSWLRWVILVLFVTTMVIFKIFNIRVNLLLYITLLAVAISLIFEEELWHRAICPYGTLLSTFSKHARVGLTINQQQCTGCGICQNSCPNNAIITLDNQRRYIVNKDCLTCFKCQNACPAGIINYEILNEERIDKDFQMMS